MTFLLLLAYLGGTITSIIELGYRFEILLLLGFAIVEVAIGFYLWVCIVSLFQVSKLFITTNMIRITMMIRALYSNLDID